VTKCDKYQLMRTYKLVVYMDDLALADMALILGR
jgi:hypothetical protein